MRALRGIRRVSGMTILIAGAAGAQWNTVSPFAGGALLLGAQGFARPPVTSAVLSGYVHVPAGAALIGGQVGTTFAEPGDSRATYAVATAAYAQRRAFGIQLYPYVALGSAAFRTEAEQLRWRPAFGGGFGMDALTGSEGRGLMLGGRVGYLTRGLNDDESVAFAAIGVGFGGRRAEGETRPVAAR